MYFILLIFLVSITFFTLIFILLIVFSSFTYKLTHNNVLSTNQPSPSPTSLIQW